MEPDAGPGLISARNALLVADGSAAPHLAAMIHRAASDLTRETH
jgi:NADPH-dependent ferric siderophore reductase